MLDTLRQTAQRAAGAAGDAVRTQANGVLDGYRDELKRAIGVYTPYRAALLFIWSAALAAFCSKRLTRRSR